MLMFPPHAYFAALNFEARMGAILIFSFNQAGYCPVHCDPVLRFIVIRVKFARV
jgi:hypothetical protein